MLRPFKLLVSSNSILLLSAYTTISNSYIYLLYTTLPAAFETAYRSSHSELNTAYLGLGTGMAVGLLYLLCVYPCYSLAARTTRHLELLLTMTLPGTVLMPVGLFMYGWSLHFQLHYSVPIVATAIQGAAFLTTFVRNQTWARLS